MGDATHTPGPWHCRGMIELAGGIDCILISAPSDMHWDVAYVAPWNPGSKADARLIAAAPTLLAVAEELAECSEYWSEYDVPLGIVDRLRAAIKAAKGEG